MGKASAAADHCNDRTPDSNDGEDAATAQLDQPGIADSGTGMLQGGPVLPAPGFRWRRSARRREPQGETGYSSIS